MKPIYFYIFFLLAFFLFPKSNIAQCPDGGNQEGGLGSGGKEIPEILKRIIEWKVAIVRALDPNDIIGPKGYAEKQWMSVNDKMGYTIRFENDPDFATAPAQNVFIHLPVNPKININSLRLNSFGFGQFNFQMPVNTTFYSDRIDLKDSLGVYVDITAGIDIIKNEVFWSFRSIDPITLKAPTDALKGFLPVNDTASNSLDSLLGKGEGYVTFLISPNKDVSTGDTISATASIVFDINEAIPTNVWTNTIDAVAPTSKISTFSVLGNVITLYWSGQDDFNASGVRDYSVYVSENSGTYTLYKNHITETSVSFTGTPGSTYSFFTLATDNTGNQEAQKRGKDISVELNGIDIPLPITWLYFTGIQQGNNVVLTWATTNEKNSKEFIIERSFDGRQFKQLGTVNAIGNTNQTSNYSEIDKDAMSLDTKILYYRLKQVDIDGKYTYSIIVAIPIKKGLQEAIVKPYPNPFKQNLSLKIITVKESDETDIVQLYSLDGRLVYQRKVSQRGSATILLENLPNLKPGIYMLHTVIAKKHYVIKMIRD